MEDMDITREIIVDMVTATNEVAFAEFLYLSVVKLKILFSTNVKVVLFLVLYSLSFFTQ